MGEDFITGVKGSEREVKGSEKEVKGSERAMALVAEEGASLSSGSIKLYYPLPSPAGGIHPPSSPFERGWGVRPLVGCVDLYAYDPVNRRCAVGIMVARDYRRQGYAIAMLKELETMASSTFMLHQLYADIAASNAASIALFHKAGYEECGRFKEWLNVKGQYIDSTRMQKIL